MAQDGFSRTTLDHLVHLMTVMTETRIEATAQPTEDNIRQAEAAAEEFQRAAGAFIARTAETQNS